MVVGNIAVLSGDGIGPEVVASAVKVLKKVGDLYGHEFKFTEALVGGAAFDEHNEHLPASTIEVCKKSDAILFGSVGGPVEEQHLAKWKDAEKISLLGLRKTFGLAVNVRPACVHSFLSDLSPVKKAHGVDLVIIRELVSGIYFGEHSTTEDGTSAKDVMFYSKKEVEIPIRFGFDLAKLRGKKVTIVDKANVLDTSRLWRVVTKEISKDYPDIEFEFMYIDNAVMQIIKDPTQFDVVVTGNMFGDILSDAASVLPGSLGLMPSASLGDSINLYEPIGGSAPDIAGQNKANPIAQILSAALLLRYTYKLDTEAKAIENAVTTALKEGARTGDLTTGKGEKVLSTSEITDRILLNISK